jgi:hypothetical protein
MRLRAGEKEQALNENKPRKQQCRLPKRSTPKNNRRIKIAFIILTQKSTGPVCLRSYRSSEVPHGISRTKTFRPSPSTGSNLGTLICRGETVQLCRAVSLKRRRFALGSISIHIGAILIPLCGVGVCRTGRKSVSDETRQHQ